VSSASSSDSPTSGVRRPRPEETIRRVTIDPHSPPEYRVFGTLVNTDAFFDAFDVQPGDGMWRDPVERVRIW
jgi:putative endopeptidase